MWESRRLPLHIAEAFQAEAGFLRALRDAMRGKKDRPISEYRRDAAVAVSNTVTAGQRLLSEPPKFRGDVESSLAAVSYCQRILHALAAISDYEGSAVGPARFPKGVRRTWSEIRKTATLELGCSIT
jgi:uncharacterized membrane protein YccC